MPFVIKKKSLSAYDFVAERGSDVKNQRLKVTFEDGTWLYLQWRGSQWIIDPGYKPSNLRRAEGRLSRGPSQPFALWFTHRNGIQIGAQAIFTTKYGGKFLTESFVASFESVPTTGIISVNEVPGSVSFASDSSTP